MITKKAIRDLTKQINKINETDELTNIYTTTTDQDLGALHEALNIFMMQQKKKDFRELQTKNNYQQMLSNISHDLKTPLTVIKGMSELIDFEHKTIADNQALLLKIQSKVEDVQMMIERFFDLNKIESADYSLTMQEHNMTELCRKILLGFYDVFEKENIKLDIDFPGNNIFVIGDEAALSRVFQNLLSNALKYGHAGKVIGCRIKERKDEVAIIIWDKGKGIDEKYYHQIFERLFTLEDSRNKNYSGSGIGLTITKRLVEKHHGTISVSSIPNQYTEFVVTLPKAR